MVKINSADLYQMAGNKEQFPDLGLDEVAFVGRSNVGKSSLLNALLRRKQLAYTGSKPGKTQTFNFYLINKAFFFVDLPGYGYAKIDKKTRAKWDKMMTEYFRYREELKLVIQLVDGRHPPTPLDKEMSKKLIEAEIPYLVVGTKKDKISNNIIQKNKSILRKELNIPEDRLYFVSIHDKNSIDELRDGIIE